MSSTVCLAPILAALMASQSFVERDDYYWETKNSNQEILFNNFWPLRSELDHILPEEVKSRASNNVDDVNGFLKKNNFDIQLDKIKDPIDKIEDPKSFYVASILDVLLTWKEKGTQSSIYDTESNKSYSAVEMQKSGQWTIFSPKSCLADKNKDPWCLFDLKIDDKILEITAKNGDKVYMKIAEKPLDGFELMSNVLELQDSLRGLTVDVDYDKVLFPIVDINQLVDISWLEKLELRFTGTENFYKIAQALQQTQLKIDENGAVVKSAVAFSYEGFGALGDIPISFVINKPFYLWVMRPGMTLPLIAAYVDESSWNEYVQTSCITEPTRTDDDPFKNWDSFSLDWVNFFE